MKKFRFFIDFEKEEAWLNEMAAQGWWFTHCTTFWGMYCFIKAAPGKANFRVDYRMFRRKSDLADYVQLFSDSGWRHLYGTKYSGNQYFIAERPDAEPDIFSDNASKAVRYRRLSEVWGTLFVIYAALIIISVVQGTMDPLAFLRPRDFYLTPGLWELTGPTFWGAFLFETPFALMRGFGWLFFAVFALAILYTTVRAYIEGRKTLKKNPLDKS